MIIALGHRARVGKDTVANALCTHWPSAQRLSFAKLLYDQVSQIQLEAGVEVKKDRELLQSTAARMQELHGADYYARHVADQIRESKSGIIIVTDLRTKIELDALRVVAWTHGRKLYAVEVQRNDATVLDHWTEHDLDDAQWDYIVANNGTIDALNKSVISLCAILSYMCCHK